MDAVGHVTSRLTAAPNTRTLKWCHWLSDSVGCSFPLWLSSLAISEQGGSLNQGGALFCCGAGVGAEAKAEASSTSTGSAAGGHMQPPMDHHDLQPGRRSSCRAICLLLWWQQKAQGLETSWCASVSAEIWGRMAMLEPGLLSGLVTHLTLNIVQVTASWWGFTTSASCSLVHESWSAAPSSGSQTQVEDPVLESLFPTVFQTGLGRNLDYILKISLFGAMIWKNK